MENHLESQNYSTCTGVSNMKLDKFELLEGSNTCFFASREKLFIFMLFTQCIRVLFLKKDYSIERKWLPKVEEIKRKWNLPRCWIHFLYTCLAKIMSTHTLSCQAWLKQLSNPYISRLSRISDRNSFMRKIIILCV